MSAADGRERARTAPEGAASAAAPHALDRPVWEALNTRQRAVALGDAQALRYLPDLAPFAATHADTPSDYAAVTALLDPDQRAVVLSRTAPPALPGMRVELVDELLQMVATRKLWPAAPHCAIVTLGHSDATEMAGLAALTQPGPFGIRTHELGQFMGLRHAGMLIAMAGTRMQLDSALGGFVEISAVCVHPAHRGHGYARALVMALATAIVARADTPFLHVLADNRAAIALYEELGFAIRQRFVIYRISRV